MDWTHAEVAEELPRLFVEVVLPEVPQLELFHHSVVFVPPQPPALHQQRHQQQSSDRQLELQQRQRDLVRRRCPSSRPFGARVLQQRRAVGPGGVVAGVTHRRLLAERDCSCHIAPAAAAESEQK